MVDEDWSIGMITAEECNFWWWCIGYIGWGLCDDMQHLFCYWKFGDGEWGIWGGGTCNSFLSLMKLRIWWLGDWEMQLLTSLVWNLGCIGMGQGRHWPRDNVRQHSQVPHPLAAGSDIPKHVSWENLTKSTPADNMATIQWFFIWNELESFYFFAS